MVATVKQNQLKSFIAGFHWKPAPKPVIETVESYALKLKRSSNHEMDRTCNSCSHQFDARKERSMKCPNCGSVDLSIG